jgi:hypothetical protein
VSNDKRAADDAERERFEKWALEEEIAFECDGEFFFVEGRNVMYAAWDAWQAALSSRADGGKDSSDAVSQVATVLKDLIETLMLWNGQASAGLDVRGLSGLRDELNAAIAGEKK